VVGTVAELSNKFSFEHVYSTIPSSGFENYKRWSQQEFLVKELFDFSKLKKYEIIVMDESDRNQLYLAFENDKDILSKIRVADNSDQIFVNSNSRIEYSMKGKVLRVSTDYAGNGHAQGSFILNADQSKYRIIKGKPLYASSQCLTFYPNIEIEFESDVCFDLLFKDLVTRKDPWKIINYCNVD
jgi:hypothetical protein